VRAPPGDRSSRKQPEPNPQSDDVARALTTPESLYASVAEWLADLPPLPDTSVVIIKGRNAIQPLTDALADTILSTFSIS
jgi:hypothetical protein